MRERRRDPSKEAKAKVFFRTLGRKYVIPATNEERVMHFLRKRLRADGYDPRNVLRVIFYFGSPVKKYQFEHPWNPKKNKVS